MDNKGLIWKLKKFQTLIDRLNTQFGGTQESFDCKFQTLIDRLNTRPGLCLAHWSMNFKPL